MGKRDEPMFKPLDFIRYIAKSMGVTVKDLRLPPMAVMVFNSKLLEVLVREFRASPRRWLLQRSA